MSLTNRFSLIGKRSVIAPSFAYRLLATLGVLCAALVVLDAASAQILRPVTKLATIKADSITESSGVAVAKIPQGGFWTHNDSGDKPRLYLLSLSGKKLAEYELKNTKCVDWEDMASFRTQSRDFLMIADVGDNTHSRSNYQLYLLLEPGAPDEKKNEIEQELVSSIQFRYEDGPRDCEAVAVDGRDMQVLLIEKINLGVRADAPPGIYQLPLSIPARESELPESELIAKRIGEFPSRGATGADISPDGTSLVIRSYLLAYLYRRELTQSWQQVVRSVKPRVVALPLQAQGEAICFTPDSKSLIITSEGRNQPIWQIDLTDN